MKILIVAGGTGGHLYPGIALARALSGHEILFVVRRGDMGRDILQKEGFANRGIVGQGLPRSISWRALAFPVNFIRGCLETRTLLREIRPDRVVGMGGYLSIPVILTAHAMGIRTLLHEQNAFPGLANRFLARWSDSIAVSFATSQSYFPPGKTWVSGLPIRPDIGRMDRRTSREQLGLDTQTATILVFGGSLGAHTLNSISVEAWPLLRSRIPAIQVIHITGMKDFARIQKLYESLNLPVKLLPYCHDMADAYAAADVVVSRAGASTVAELLEVRRPALLIPYPYASNNHQVYNAKVLESEHLGHIVLQDSLTPSVMANRLYEILKAGPIQESASPASSKDAARRLAAHLL